MSSYFLLGIQGISAFIKVIVSFLDQDFESEENLESAIKVM